RFGNVVEDALTLLLLDLQPFPVLAHAARRVSGDVSEDVRVASDELGVDRTCDLLEITLPTLLEQQRKEVDLEEQITELAQQLRAVVSKRSVRNLVRLLERMRHDRLRRLLAIPRAVTPQPLGQLLELEQRVGECHVSPS